jgi:Ser/Thr protein kinase RdoA (MazF antagonist)
MVDWVRARVHSPLISEARAAEVLERFGVHLESRPANLSLNWRNRNVIVHTSAGKKVLKQYRETSNLDTITNEHSIIEHLRRRRFPAVRLNHTLVGGTSVELDDLYYALFDFEYGRQLTSSFMTTAQRQALAGEAGRTLGLLHVELDGFRPAGGHHLGFDPESGERQRDLTWYLDVLESLRSRPETSGGPEARSCADWLREQSDFIGNSLNEVAEIVQRADLPRLVIHGDYGSHNLLFRRDGTALVHDFELARLDWRLLDLVMTLPRLTPDAQRQFVAGYRTTNDLDGKELKLVPDLWRYHQLTGSMRSWYGYTELGGEQRLLSARTRVSRAQEGPTRGLAQWS